MTKNCCVVIYPDPGAIEQALENLQTADCDLRKVSVIAAVAQSEDAVVGIYCIENDRYYLGKYDNFWNSLWQRLPGSAFFREPDFGLLLIAGQIVSRMVHGMEHVDISDGFSFLGNGLFFIGVPRASINEYEQAIKSGKLLLLFNGERQDVERVCSVLHNESQQVSVHYA